MYRYVRRHLLAAFIVLFVSCDNKQYPSDEWPIYGGSNSRVQYSDLDQINVGNVKNLQVAWTYHTRDADATSQIQANPLIVGNVLYGVSAQLKLFAVDAATGEEQWQFDPSEWMRRDRETGMHYGINACRGIALYRGKKGNDFIFYSVGPFLYCIESRTGTPVLSFGNGGRVSLHEGLDVERDISRLRVTSTTPGIIYGDLLILGTSLSEDEEAAPGHIRAYDVHTGKIQWTFHTIPYPGEPGYETWDDAEAYRYVGGANAWGGFSLDVERGIVFTSTGTSNPDYYGGHRKGDNLFANCVLALDAVTGKRIWHYQIIHHDLWDWDLPTAPVLVTVNKHGKKVDAVVQVTKHGFVFLLDRLTGEPLYPVEERSVPTTTDLVGESLSPTQPFPTFIAPFVRQEFREADLNANIPDSSYQQIRRRFAQHRSGKMFTPPSIEGTIVFPGLNGGAEWGGPAVDPINGIMYINASEMPWIVTMKVPERAEGVLSNETNLQAGKRLYDANCSTCHGPLNSETMNYAVPALNHVAERYTERDFKDLVTSGRRKMPAFKDLTEGEKEALASYVLELEAKQADNFITVAHKEEVAIYKTPYVLAGVQQFLTPEGYPAIAPPWGTLSAIDLNTGEYLWKTPLGEFSELKASNMDTGSENIGGLVVTGGGLVFIAATRDEKFRAFDKETGKLLFETTLPAAGYATPSVYSINGKQYIVIACGGGKLGTKSGDAYVAFTLAD